DGERRGGLEGGDVADVVGGHSFDRFVRFDQLVHASRTQAVEGPLAIEVACQPGVNEQLVFAPKAAGHEKERRFVAPGPQRDQRRGKAAPPPVFLGRGGGEFGGAAPPPRRRRRTATPPG